MCNKPQIPVERVETTAAQDGDSNDPRNHQRQILSDPVRLGRAAGSGPPALSASAKTPDERKGLFQGPQRFLQLSPDVLPEAGELRFPAYF